MFILVKGLKIEVMAINCPSMWFGYDKCDENLAIWNTIVLMLNITDGKGDIERKKTLFQ